MTWKIFTPLSSLSLCTTGDMSKSQMVPGATQQLPIINWSWGANWGPRWQREKWLYWRADYRALYPAEGPPPPQNPILPRIHPQNLPVLPSPELATLTVLYVPNKLLILKVLCQHKSEEHEKRKCTIILAVFGLPWPWSFPNIFLKKT